MKISAFSPTNDGSDDSLLMISYTDDGGLTYKTRKIRLEDFIDDFDVENLANVDGTPTEGQVLQFSGSTWSPVDADLASGGGGGGGPIATTQQVIAEDITFAAGINGASYGDTTVEDGFTVEVPAGSTWFIYS